MNVFSRILVLAVVAGVPAGTPARAQTSPAPVHKHYEKPDGYAQPTAPGAPIAPRLQNLGVHTFPVSTKVERAQAFVSQGVNLAYGFNHAEAARAFAEAARLDPDLAMAYWGHALVLGPNINAPMAPEDEPKAYELVQKAVSRGTGTTARDPAACPSGQRPVERMPGEKRRSGPP
jgi:alkylation response protein AidB-like acyl-CoA dehydrogenase